METSYNVNFFSLDDNDNTCADDDSIPHTYGNWEAVKQLHALKQA